MWSTDNDKTDANDEVVIKSVYDPSPVGYSLPASNAFTGFTTTGQNVGSPTTPFTSEQVNAKLPFDKGYYFYTKLNKQGTITFFPTSGFRHDRYGFLLGVNTSGYCWMASLVDMSNSYSLVFSSSAVYPLHHDSRSCGLPVRSAEEMETHKFNIKHEMDGRYYNLWSTDNDRTVPNDEVVIKTVYDPSPVGYSLPASNAFTGFTTTGQNAGNPAEYNVKGNFDKGWYFYTQKNKQGNTMFFPTDGIRDHLLGTLNYVTINSYYWTAGPSSAEQGRFLNFNSYSVGPLGFVHYRTWGFSVRSAEEK